jgi:hypothetical protein
MPINPAFLQPIEELPLFALTELEQKANAAQTTDGGMLGVRAKSQEC